MAIWDEQRWKEFEANARRVRRERLVRQRRAERARYAGARSLYWIALALVIALWMI